MYTESANVSICVTYLRIENALYINLILGGTLDFVDRGYIYLKVSVLRGVQYLKVSVLRGVGYGIYTRCTILYLKVVGLRHTLLLGEHKSSEYGYLCICNIYIYIYIYIHMHKLYVCICTYMCYTHS